jgi:hypothetical protein
MTAAEAAARLRALAERLETVPEAEFGGVFLIGPPGDDTLAIDGISVTGTPLAAVFWSAVEGQVSLAINAYKDARGPFRR